MEWWVTMKAARKNNYTKEEEAFVRELFDNKASDAEDVALFNERFPHRNITQAAYRSLRKRLGLIKHFAHVYFTEEEDAFIKENLQKYRNLFELTDAFNVAFPHHQTTHMNIQKRMAILGIKKGTRKWRSESKAKVSRHPIGYISVHKRNDHNGVYTRIKTEDGYKPANKWYIENVYGKNWKEYKLLHLNGDGADFSPENLMCVTTEVISSMSFRSWFFTDAELTKTAALTAELLLCFPDLCHNENQYYRMIRSETE